MKIKIELASQHCYIGAQSGDRSNQIAAANSLARIHVGCRYDDDDEHTEASTPHSTFHRYSVHHIFVYWRTLFYFSTASPITNPSIRNLSNRSKKYIFFGIANYEFLRPGFDMIDVTKLNSLLRFQNE